MLAVGAMAERGKRAFRKHLLHAAITAKPAENAWKNLLKNARHVISR
jgi:hypothetical protein